MKRPIRKAVFPVAGLGTRFLPATKAIPKEMLTLVDRPLIQYAVDQAKAAGIEEFIFVTSRNKTALEDHFDHNHELDEILERRGKTEARERLTACEIDSGHLYFTRQNRPLGLGHAVWCARHVIGDDPFAVILPDEVVMAEKPVLKQMIEIHRELGGNLIAIDEVSRDETYRYGILDVESDDGKLVKVRGLVEKPAPQDAPSNLCITGPYILQPEIFDHLEKHQIGAGGEIHLTDAMACLINQQPFHGMRFEGRRFDIGSMHGFIEANIAFAAAREDLKETVCNAYTEFVGPLCRPNQA